MLIGLRQDAVTTSADFDWAYLSQIFTEHVLDHHGQPRTNFAWNTTPARPSDPTDKTNWQAMIRAGAPTWWGKGWGMRATRSAKTCFFGARFTIPPDSTLAQIDSELRRVQPLLLEMAGG